MTKGDVQYNNLEKLDAQIELYSKEITALHYKIKGIEIAKEIIKSSLPPASFT
jgi:prefoldin subunit 5